ncbi:copper-containing nitrite reductase [Bradyrhizobium betae]|uniref:Copper-containing nitrite reductase n=1 Tax=Bradyrhizobium betae TaxID=244734 RepID=A0A5P6NZJ6_9BRAD|nr:copper-containing nitrite reductase [Bradyrhizobium betae]MCS3725354.1 nitrite reductase (NO-forming) [Bradyrhizobium betae]QFI71336.1 nitrite reductase, copper-containing [Bradyrhizobium betae]
MWDTATEALRRWSILLIGLVLIVGGLWLGQLFYSTESAGLQNEMASSEKPSGDTSHQMAHVTPPDQSTRKTTAEPQRAQASTPPARQQTPPSSSETAASPRAVEQKRADEPHDHMAQMASVPAPTPSGQAAPVAQSATSVAGAAPAAGAGDAAAGRLVFRKCQACHSLDAGKNMLGPSLAGVIGRKSGTEPGYNYSPAMKQADLVWDPQTLDRYLGDPAKVVPGNKMPFPGLKTDHDRADVIAYLATAAAAGQSAAGTPIAQAQPTPAGAPPPSRPQSATGADIGYVADARYTLRSGIAEGRMVYIGVGGAIEGKVNPVLTASEGQVVQLTLINGEGAEHDIVFPDQDTKSPRVTGKGASTTIAFRAGKSGDFTYYCSVPGHRLAGMEGQFIVTPRPSPQTVVEADISREPGDLSPPIGKRDPQTVRVDLLSVEVEGRLAEGTTFGYWTFNGKVPGPFIRVRVGDTVDIHLKNSADSAMIHSVDFHAATGPGGGAAALQVDPGGEKSMTWKALVPGLFVYHCATPMVAEHIANGMYGLILVEPEGGLPPVDHEFYVMQGEIYSDIAFGQHGSAEFSVDKLLNERPEYFVFNGSVGALTKLHPLEAKVGDTVRIFFGVGGPNYTSSFHVIGEIFDKVYNLGGITSPPLEGIQTVMVPAGGAVITEFKLDVPGNYTLVDHALARMERGLLGVLHVEGPKNPEIFNGEVMPGMGH